jgi:hypothetical protein
MPTEPPKPAWLARDAWVAGLALFALETAQSVLLLPLLPRWMPLSDVTLWISLTAGLGLVNAAAAAYAQPLVRNIADRGVQHGMPPNWPALLRQADRHGLVLLLLMLSAFGLFLNQQVRQGSLAVVLAVLIFFAAMFCKLLALNRFVGLNGLAQIGRDKRILLLGSAVSLAAALVLAPMTGATWGLALASLAGASCLAVLAGQATRRLADHQSGPAAKWPARRETTGLVLLHLCGYLNMGTDVLMSNHWLPGPQAIAYAFWSRTLTAVCLLTGMYAQIRFPAWATLSPCVLRQELRLVWLACAAGPLLLLPAYAVVAKTPWANSMCLLPWWTVLTMVCNCALCCSVMVAGQLSIARSAHGFVLSSSLLACLAPLLAGSAAWLWQPMAFVLGYASIAFALAFVNVRHAMRSLQHPKSF